MKKTMIKGFWLGVVAVMAGCASDELQKPETGSADASAAPEPGTQEYYELKIKGRYALDGEKLISITDPRRAVHMRNLGTEIGRPKPPDARWLEGPILQVISNNLAVVGKPVTNLSGAVTWSRMGVVTVADAQKVTTGEVRRMLAVPTERYSYLTASGESGTLSAYRQVFEPTYDEYLAVFTRDRLSAPVGTVVAVERITDAPTPSVQTTGSLRLPLPLPQDRRQGREPTLSFGNYTYITNATGGAIITGYDKGRIGRLAITNALNECPVVGIASWAFASCTNLTEVTLPDTIPEIDWGTFSGCTGLRKVAIPDNITNIGERAFSDCTALENVILPEKASAPDDFVFEGHEGLSAIASYAFYNCSSLTNITIAEGLTNIAWSAFYGCTNLPARMKQRFPAASRVPMSPQPARISRPLPTSPIRRPGPPSQPSTESPTRPQATSNGIPYTFVTNNNAITITKYTGPGGDVTIPNTINGLPVTAIKDYAFYRRDDLTSLVLSPGILSVGRYAFSWCENLTSVALPESVTTIDHGAFSGCGKLTSFHIPANVTFIGYRAFTWDRQLRVSVDEANPAYKIVDGILYTKDGMTLHTCSREKSAVVIPEGVTSIGPEAFIRCGDLTSLTIPESVTSVGDSAFWGCGVTSLSLPSNLTEIRGDAFRECNNLSTLTLPLGVTSIGGCAFADCLNLTTLTITPSVKIIGGGAFSGCPKLKVTLDNANVSFQMQSGVLYTSDGKTLHTMFADQEEFVVPSSVTTIANSAFSHKKKLNALTVPASVSFIGGWTFYGSRGLKTIRFEGDAPKVHSAIFYNAPYDLIVYVPAGSKGWDGKPDSTELPAKWYNRTIRHIDSRPATSPQLEAETVVGSGVAVDRL